jgi:transposase
MKCPNCDAEMYQSDEDDDVWVCPECGLVEDRS